MAAVLLGTGRLSAIAVTMARLTLLGKGGDPPDGALASQTVPVSSSAIRSIGWRSDGIIVVEFRERGTYTYDGDYETFLAFVTAPSKGVFFNQNFR